MRFFRDFLLWIDGPEESFPSYMKPIKVKRGFYEGWTVLPVEAIGYLGEGGVYRRYWVCRIVGEESATIRVEEWMFR